MFYFRSLVSSLKVNSSVPYWQRLFLPVNVALSGSLRSIMDLCKPPNIFIYTGESASNSERFLKLKKALEQCLNLEKYVIYHLHTSKLEAIPWQDNTVALLTSFEEEISDTTRDSFLSYSKSGGKILSLCSKIALPGLVYTKASSSAPTLVSFRYGDCTEAKCFRSSFQMSYDEGREFEVLARESLSSCPVILKCPSGEGTIVISQIGLVGDAVAQSSNENDFHTVKDSEEACLRCLRDILSTHLVLDCSPLAAYALTPLQLIHRPGSGSLQKKLLSHLNGDVLRLHRLSMKFTKDSIGDAGKIDLAAPYPVIIREGLAELDGFDAELFFEHLDTRLFGSVVFYTDTLTSTMDVLEGLPADIGAVSIANIQTKGIGRGGNVWLSPRGAAMFSIQVCLDRNSHLGQSLPFVQQLVTVALIRAIKTLPGGYKDLDVGLKWPNDLYYAKKVKIGGILAKSTMVGSLFHSFIGLGVNLSNSQPTVCLNDIISLHNKIHGTSMQTLKAEVMIARTLNYLEEMIDQCQKEGISSCLPDVYTHWIHKNQVLKLEATNEEVTIQGIDEYGFLLVQNSKGQVLTLHPDGNGLDQMKNLLVAKKHQ